MATRAYAKITALVRPVEPASHWCRDNFGLNLSCANGASQKFACAIFKDCAPCYHMSQIIAENTSVLGFGATSFI